MTPRNPTNGVPIIEAHDLTAGYGGAPALTGASLSLLPGGALAVLGPNGAGKTTLARCLSGQLAPLGGRVLVDGHDVTRLPAHRIARLGVAHLPEGRGVFPGLSVTDNLRAGLRHRLPRGDRQAGLARALELFPVLASRRRQLAGTLSGGEQQMLALARVLAAPPRVVIADELSLGLAPMLVDAVFSALARARDAGSAIVVIEQFVSRALALADHAIVLSRGRPRWSGPSAEANDAAGAHYL